MYNRGGRTPRSGPAGPLSYRLLTSYDDWLSASGLDTDTIPTPVQPHMTNEYRGYINMPPPMRRFHHLHDDFQQGNVAAYGTHDDLLGEPLPMFGPLDLFHTFESQQDFGPEYGKGFSKDDYRGVLTRHGYHLESILASDANNPLDHQVWKVRRIGTQMILACKIASSSFHASHMGAEVGPQQIVDKVTHEARILSECNHQNIIKLLDVIEIEDRVTGFPYNFVATIMELMNGTVESLMQSYPNCELPRHMAQRCLKDCVLAVDYLHNQMDHIRVAHLAIMPRNILYNIPIHFGIPVLEMAVFKLSDFEECIVYDRRQEKSDIAIDLWQSHTRPPYSHEFSAPEFIQAIYDPDLLENLRLFPNDIYCIAFTVVYLLIGGEGQLNQMRLLKAGRKIQEMSKSVDQPLDEVIGYMTIKNPEQRINAANLVALPAFNSLVETTSLLDQSFTSLQL